MSDPLGEIGIAEGDETPLREILAPQKGDDYISSYYAILRTIEQATVYTAETQAGLPDDGGVDWSLVGIAETEADEFVGDSVHIYDGDEWVDTFQTIDKFVQGLNNEIDNLDVDDIENLRNELDRIDREIGNIEGDIGDIENDIGNVPWWTDLQSQIESIENDIDSIENDINSIEGDIGDVPWWENSLQSQIDDLRNDINEINNTVGISDLRSGSQYVGRVKPHDLSSDHRDNSMHDGRNGFKSWDLKDEVWGFDESNTLLFASIETQPWTSIEHYYAGVITTSVWSSGTVSGFFIMNWDSEVKVNINYLYY